MTVTVADVLSTLGVKRVAHFTPSKNLFHIVQDGQVTSSADLATHAPEYFDPTDTDRFDRRPEMTCVSFTYPNGFYLSKAQVKSQFERFSDWVCLLLDANLLTRPGVLFSPCNAARGGGAYLAEGPDGLQSCFENPSVMGYTRSSLHHPFAATDLQAEALIPGPISLTELLGIVVPTSDDAGNEFARLEIAGLNPSQYKWLISPVFFNRNSLRYSIQNGRQIEEIPWTPPAAP